MRETKIFLMFSLPFYKTGGIPEERLLLLYVRSNILLFCFRSTKSKNSRDYFFFGGGYRSVVNHLIRNYSAGI